MFFVRDGNTVIIASLEGFQDSKVITVIAELALRRLQLRMCCFASIANHFDRQVSLANMEASLLEY